MRPIFLDAPQRHTRVQRAQHSTVDYACPLVCARTRSPFRFALPTCLALAIIGTLTAMAWGSLS
jgi:hypothetical protein